MLSSTLMIIFVLTFEICSSTANVAHLSPVEKPHKLADREGCFWPKANLVLPYDVNIYPKSECQKLICGHDGYVTVYSCDTKPDCFVEQNSNLLYPECCTCTKLTNSHPIDKGSYPVDDQGDNYEREETREEVYYHMKETARTPPGM